MSASLSCCLLNIAKFSASNARYFSHVRQFHHSRVAISGKTLQEKFSSAQDLVGKLQEDPGNEAKLKIYALFKQATGGPCDKPKPGIMDFVGKAKWEAWKGLGDISKDQAMGQYVELVMSLAEAEGPQPEHVENTKYTQMIVTKDGPVMNITLNRPKKKNAINYKMYDEWSGALEEASQDESVHLVVITGAGDYFCSGNDLANFANVGPSEIASMAQKGGEILRRFVTAFIDFPKPLVGLINGPAIGVSVTTLGLYDFIYASDKATFHTPFTVLGQSAEGCSSIVFPKIMGHLKAADMLLFNKKLTAQEALDRNLVSAVFPDAVFKEQTAEIIKQMAELPKDSFKLGKVLMRDVDRDALHKANDRECMLLVERWQSSECVEAIMKFFMNKQN
ncbi:enoyl-CoA delta isomerase 2-like [Lineus longissimus]|uniref:enoyl-CoA delta isomerase 2-like n=1 Tax=Lineus longissimus TaxID=88925 RepID=UPI002B4E7C72